MLTSSGQAANFYAIMNICEEGDHIVCASALYGGNEFNMPQESKRWALMQHLLIRNVRQKRVKCRIQREYKSCIW